MANIENIMQGAVNFGSATIVNSLIHAGTRDNKNGMKSEQFIKLAALYTLKCAIDIYHDSLNNLSPNKELTWADATKLFTASVVSNMISGIEATFQSYYIFSSMLPNNYGSPLIFLVPISLYTLYENPDIISKPIYAFASTLSSSEAPCIKASEGTQLLTKNLIPEGYKQIDYANLSITALCLDEETKENWVKLALDIEEEAQAHIFISSNSTTNIYDNKFRCPSGTEEVNKFLVSDAYHYDQLIKVYYAISDEAYQECNL